MSADFAVQPTGDDRLLNLLAEGEVELIGRIMPSSNLALLVEVSTKAAELACTEPRRSDEARALAVYKPESGERQLWDFEPGLHRRELAAYLLSEWLGWGLVPPTVVRDDAPVGVGSLQLYIDADESQHYFTLDQRAPEVCAALHALALFDLVANNADRKSGHVLRDADGRIWAIDNGLCFAADFKLRTVIWDFAGELIPEDLLSELAPLLAEVPAELAALLGTEEVSALRTRVRSLLKTRRFPIDHSGRRVPWPLV